MFLGRIYGDYFIGKTNHWVNLLAEAQKISLWFVECLKETTKEKKIGKHSSISSLGLVFWVGFLLGFDYQPQPYSRQFRIRISSAGSTDGEWTLWFLWFWTWISLHFTHWTARNHGRNLLKIKRKNSEKVPMRLLFSMFCTHTHTPLPGDFLVVNSQQSYIASNFSLHVMMTISVPFKNYPKKSESQGHHFPIYICGAFSTETAYLRFKVHKKQAKNSCCFSRIPLSFFLDGGEMTLTAAVPPVNSHFWEKKMMKFHR